jgi:hypothetical protein
VKNPPTLADACVATVFDKGPYGRGYGTRFRSTLMQIPYARKFVLDDAMSRYIADLTQHTLRGRQRDARVGNFRQTARAPHALTWVEFNFKLYKDRTRELGYFKVTSDPDTDIPTRFGWLIEQHPHNPAAFRCVEIRSTVNVEGLAYVHSVALTWCCDNLPSPYRPYPDDKDNPNGAKDRLELHAHFTTVNPGHQDRPGFTEMLTGNDYKSEAELRSRVFPMTPPVTIWAFLATIDDLPVRYTEVRPDRGFMARGNYRKFLQHSIITLNVPETRWRRLTLKAATLIRRRAHQVRGFWRRDWRHPGCAGANMSGALKRICWPAVAVARSASGFTNTSAVMRHLALSRTITRCMPNQRPHL